MTPGNQEGRLTLEMLAYVRIFDMRRYCQELAPMLTECYPELAKKMQRAEQSFAGWMKEIESGSK